MNTHVKITDSAPADLSRRSFLVGSAATGLVLGYAGPVCPASIRPWPRPPLSSPASGSRLHPTASSR